MQNSMAPLSTTYSAPVNAVSIPIFYFTAPRLMSRAAAAVGSPSATQCPTPDVRAEMDWNQKGVLISGSDLDRALGQPAEA